MPRIRTIKPEIWMSPQVMNLSAHARLLFLGLITQADDHGRGHADARRLKAAIFGGDDVTSTNVRRWLDECVAQRLVVLYEDVSHGILYALPSWKMHQSIDRPKPSAYPEPPQPAPLFTPSSIDRRTIVDQSTNDREGSEGKGTEGNGRDRKSARAPETGDPPVRVDELVAPEVSREAIAEWRQHREALGRPLRPHELIAFGKTLRAAGPPAAQLATVRNCIANGWANLRHADTQGGNGAAPVVQTWAPPDDEPPEERARA